MVLKIDNRALYLQARKQTLWFEFNSALLAVGLVLMAAVWQSFEAEPNNLRVWFPDKKTFPAKYSNDLKVDEHQLSQVFL